MRSFVRPARWGAAVLTAIAVFTACSPSSADFKEDAEQFLRSDEMFTSYGLDIASPTCPEPEAIETGVTLVCTGQAADGTIYRFTFEVAGSKQLTLREIGNPQLDADQSPVTEGATGTSAPADSSLASASTTGASVGSTDVTPSAPVPPSATSSSVSG